MAIKRLSWTYPAQPGDPDRQGVLRNKFGIRSHSALSAAEFAASRFRYTQIDQGKGPCGNFDAAHLRALHGHLFQDVYEWAGTSRNLHATIEGARLPPVEFLGKGSTSFLLGSRIGMGLTSALADARPDELSQETAHGFAMRAGAILAELNYVHPFREGNGRAQACFISELGRASGHKVHWSVISTPHLLHASIETSDNPDSPAMRRLMADAVVPGRVAALRDAFEELDNAGYHAMRHYIRTAHPGEHISGLIISINAKFAMLANKAGFIVLDRSDMPEKITDLKARYDITASSDFSAPGQKK